MENSSDQPTITTQGSIYCQPITAAIYKAFTFRGQFCFIIAQFTLILTTITTKDGIQIYFPANLQFEWEVK